MAGVGQQPNGAPLCGATIVFNSTYEFFDAFFPESDRGFAHVRRWQQHRRLKDQMAIMDLRDEAVRKRADEIIAAIRADHAH